MGKTKAENIFTATNSLKVLSYLIKYPGKEFLCSEIQKNTSISRAGVYVAVRELEKNGLVSRSKKGKQFLYSVIYDEPVIKQFKVLQNILALRPQIAKLKQLCKKVILYGSAARGENDPESDVDLFILTQDHDKVKKIISFIRSSNKIKAVIKTPVEFSEQKEAERVYYGEVDRGIVLWEEKL